MSEMRRVYMSFFNRGEWVVSFLEADLSTPIGHVRKFASDHKVLETAKRGRAFKTLADHQAFAAAIENGRGGIYLSLSDDEYRRLQASHRGSI